LWLVLRCGAVALLGQIVPVSQNLWRLLDQEDTDRDRRITVRDRVTPFDVRDRQGATVRTVGGVYPLSVLMQELKRLEDGRQTEVELARLPLDETAADRTHRLIRDFYWDALTRRIDAAHLDQVLADPKVQSNCDYLYVPASDEAALRYFSRCEQIAAEQKRSPALRVLRLPPPRQITGPFIRNLDGQHGLLSLALETNSDGQPLRGVPYVVPGGRFNELYYWDSYFTVLGLLADGRTDLARGQADNLLYEIQAYGMAPNANRTYYLTRSQPPLLTSIIRAVYEAKAADSQWLESALKTALAEYRAVWMGPDRLVKVGPHALNRYYDIGEGPCPEVEPGHYDQKIEPWMRQAEAAGLTDSNAPLTPFRFLNQYLYCGRFGGFAVNGLTLDAFFTHDRAVRESGHDTTHRFDDRTADFLPCDLNALLYRYEMDFAELLETNFGGQLASLGPGFDSAASWKERARARKQAMMELMWDEGRGFFFDYDFANRKRSTYISATGLFPLWAGMLDQTNAREQQDARIAAAFAERELEEYAGLAATARKSVESARTHDARQWDYPYGWPPHQMMAWQALRRYGLQADAERLAYRWLYALTRNARDYNGTIPEKLNVVTGSHEVFVEYGNVGTRFDYIAPEGFGWMNASFQVGLKNLTPSRKEDLRHLKPPPPKESAAAKSTPPGQTRVAVGNN
jgi:alpha,alpha-trehalase